jgi:xanthine dehydrogenase/oxidase
MPSMPDTSTVTTRGLPLPASFRSSTLVFALNSTKIVLDNPDPDLTLLEFIRAQGFTGTKLGCNEGESRREMLEKLDGIRG